MGSPASRRRAFTSSRLFIFIPLGLGLLVAAGALIHHLAKQVSRRGQPHPTNEHLAHDPTQPRRARNVYDETVEGAQYRNHDLRLAIARPEGWEMSTGARPEYGEKYEGLVVKIAPPIDPKKGEFAPLVSVVRRALKNGTPVDPLGYVQGVLLKGQKEVLEPPSLVTINRLSMARVAYLMAGDAEPLVVTQYVVIRDGAAYALSVACRRDEFDRYKETFESVVASFQVGA